MYISDLHDFMHNIWYTLTCSDLIKISCISTKILLGHLSHSGDLLLWVGVRRPLTFSKKKLLSQSRPNLVSSIYRVRRQELKTPYLKGKFFGVKSVKLMYFLKNLLLYSQALIRQTKYVVMMTKEGSTKIINFMTPGTGVLVLGRCHINHSENTLVL